MAERISLAEAARRAGVTPATLKRWAELELVPLEDGRWTEAAAAQARVFARMRERGHSLEELGRAAREGRFAFGRTEDLLPKGHREVGIADAARETGLEPALIERIMTLTGAPVGGDGKLTRADTEALRHCAKVLESGFPLVAFLQLMRVYAHSLQRIADAETRLFHLYVHEPMIRDGVPSLEIAEGMASLASEVLPVTKPLMEYLHDRYLRHYIEQDVVGHMESELEEGAAGRLDRVQMAVCFVDLTGFTQYTEEEGDEQALDVVERFIESVEGTLPAGAQIVKTIGDEVMIVSPDAGTLTEWAVGFLSPFQERPQPRVGIHRDWVVYRDGDYFGAAVNLASRVVARALGGEVMVTESVVRAIGEIEQLEFEPIGEVGLKGFLRPVPLFVVRPAGE